MSADKHSKTEAPTPKRKKEARKDGQIPRSREISVWVSILVASASIQALFRSGSHALTKLNSQVANVMAQPTDAGAVQILGKGLGTVLTVVAPFMITMLALAVVTNLAQTGLAFSTKKLKPSFARLNPAKGVKNLLSPASAWEGAKSLIKIAVLGVIGWQSLASAVPQFTTAGSVPLGTLLAFTAGRALSFIRTVATAGLVLAAMDYGIQRHRIRKSLMMSKQEIREESKQADGNPEIKGAIRRKQLRMSRLRMIAEVAKADAVIVNPTHFSVAIRYDPAAGAPRVVAKGADEVAMRIREEARKHQVPIVEDPPLARTLHRVCELGDEIPADLYEAVARLLAFLFNLRSRGRISTLGSGVLRPPPSPVGV